MSTTAIILLAAVVIVIAAAVLWSYRQRQARRFKERFGPEYDHAVHQYGSESRAQAALAARTRRVEGIHIRSLAPEDRDRFHEQWEDLQRGFVDDPSGSIRQADRLVNDLMGARGYPMADFEHRAEDISVDHPKVVQNYRYAHSIAGRQEQGEASTEDLRQALVHYRALFDELLETRATAEGRTRG